MDYLYRQALEMMKLAFDALSIKVGNPQLQRMGNGYVYRYKEKSIYQAIIQKLARLVTGLQAISVLNQAGFLQEQAALQRTLDEFEEDIAFLCFGIIFNEITDLHREYLTAFYEEEFDNPASSIRSTQKRPMIPRRKIRAFVSKDRGAGYDKSSTIEISRTLSKGYSGYVHGASPHLMELYFGDPPRFQLSGGIESPFYKDHIEDMLNYFYRSMLSFAFAAKAFSEEALFTRVADYSRKFAIDSGREYDLREPRGT
ncbi:hypothetical protein ACFL0Q_00600 [Thermodesulfobacteriota bacterium]